jgi:HK97 family phage major capsid protein
MKLVKAMSSFVRTAFNNQGGHSPFIAPGGFHENHLSDNHAVMVDSGVEFCNAVREARKVIHVEVDSRRFKNDLTPWTSPGWPLDGDNVVQAVVFAQHNFSPVRRLATVGQLDRTLNSIVGGVDDIAVEATPIAPGSPLSNTDPDFTATKLEAVVFGTPQLYITRQLLEDSPKLAASVAGILQGRLSRGQNRYFTGATTGRTNNGGLVPGAYGVTSISSTVVGIADLNNLIGVVPGDYRESKPCCWMMHSAVEQVLMQLADSTGTPIWKRAMLDRWPIVLNDHMDSTIAAGNTPILFGDLSQFHISDYGITRFEMLYEPRAEFGEVVAQAWSYCDGGLVAPGAQSSHPPVAKLVMHS